MMMERGRRQVLPGLSVSDSIHKCTDVLEGSRWRRDHQGGTPRWRSRWGENLLDHFVSDEVLLFKGKEKGTMHGRTDSFCYGFFAFVDRP